MAYFKSMLFITAVVSSALGAPKPLSWDDIGRNVKYYSNKALPVANGMCGFLNGIQGIPMGYPQFGGFQQGAYPGMYPGYSPNPGFQVLSVPTSGAVPSGGASEQDDLISQTLSNLSPQSQQVFKDHNNAAKLVSSSGDTLTKRNLQSRYHLD